MQLPFEEWTYVGEEAGVSCPVCHCNIIYVEKDLPEIMCPICEVHGTVSVEGDRLQVAWNQDDAEEPRFSTRKEIHHLGFIERHEAEEAVQVALPGVQDELRTYNAYGKVIAPRTKAKK